MSTVTLVHLALRVRHVSAAFIELRSFHNYPGLIFPRNLWPMRAARTLHQPLLPTLKEKK
jgi:hypothetical protein